MSSTVKTRSLFGWLFLAQTACIIAGLGFFYLYASSTLMQTAADQAKSELTADARSLSAVLAEEGLTSIAQFGDVQDAAVREKTAKILQHALPVEAKTFVADPAWRVVFDPSETNNAGPPRTLEWNTSVPVQREAEQPVYGPIRSTTGSRIGAAYPLASRDGYVVVDSDLDAILVSPAAVREQLATGSLVSLLWMAGLMAISVFMVVSYFQAGRAREQNAPDVDNWKQTQSLLRTQETVIFALAKLSDSRDPETGDHLERISYYSSTLAAALRQHPDFRDQVSPALVRLIGISSALHDIGKVGVEDAILKKPGTLTEAERSRMQRHTRVGEDCLKEIERRLGTSNFLQMAREIASAHHERWDGAGYPLGLAGEQIPLAARIVAIADVYDALSSKRVYKEALPHEECVELIVAEGGKHFDPRMVEVFAQIEPSFRAISGQLKRDSSAKPQDHEVHLSSAGHEG